MTNNAQLLPLPVAEYRLSPDSKPSLYDADQMQSYALACIEAAKPADALGSLPVVADDLEELIGVYWDIAYQEGHLGRSDGSAAQETLNRIRAEIAKRDALCDMLAAELKLIYQGKRIGLYSAALATYEAAQGEKT